MKEVKDWISFYVPLVFNRQAERIKISRKDFSKNIGETYQSGIIKGLEMAIEKIRNEEDRGEIHILLTNTMNDFHKLGLYKVSKTTIEKTIKLYETGE